MSSRPRYPLFAAPKGNDVYELYTLTKSRPGVLHELTGILAKANVDILSGQVQILRNGLAEMIAFVEMGAATTTVDRLLASIRASKTVITAKAERKDRVRYEGFLFPILLGEESAGFFLAGSGWRSIAKSIVNTFGTGGQMMLYGQGVAYGKEAIGLMSRRLGQVDARTALDNFAAMFKATGKGILEVSERPLSFDVVIREPFGNAKEVEILDHFLVGVVAGAIGDIYSAILDVEDIRPSRDGLSFKLVRSTEPLISYR